MKVRDKGHGTRDTKNSYPVSHIPFPYVSFPKRYINNACPFLLLITFLFTLISLTACEQKKKPVPQVTISNEGQVLLDSGLSAYRVRPWFDGEDRRITILPKGGDSVSIGNKVIAESRRENRTAYVFLNGARCLGSMLTDSLGSLQNFEPSIACFDSVTLDQSSVRILWSERLVPALAFSEDYGERGRTLRVHRLDGIAGDFFIDEFVSNDEACGDDGILPCFSQKSEISFPADSAFLPETLLVHVTGTMLDGKRVLPVDRTDTIIPFSSELP
jgi:hypothetical protein